jgi:hypothetical protein
MLFAMLGVSNVFGMLAVLALLVILGAAALRERMAGRQF